MSEQDPIALSDDTTSTNDTTTASSDVIPSSDDNTDTGNVNSTTDTTVVTDEPIPVTNQGNTADTDFSVAELVKLSTDEIDALKTEALTEITALKEKFYALIDYIGVHEELKVAKTKMTEVADWFVERLNNI